MSPVQSHARHESGVVSRPISTTRILVIGVLRCICGAEVVMNDVACIRYDGYIGVLRTFGERLTCEKTTVQ